MTKHGQGCYRRRVIARVGEGEVVAGVEDDFHHFRVRIEHSGGVVTDVSSSPIRVPWATCPGAVAPLRQLIGQTIGTNAVRRDDTLDRHHQCTHQLELALFAIAQAARGSSRRYDVTMADPPVDQPSYRNIELRRDGAVVEAWQVRGDVIVSPDWLADKSLRAMRHWPEAREDDAAYERFLIVRRCLQVSRGRSMAVKPDNAMKVPENRNACYAFQDERVAAGNFIYESVQDFSTRPDDLLADLV